MIIKIKQIKKHLSYLGISNPKASLIVEMDASHIGYGGILKQDSKIPSKEQIIRYYLGIWHPAQ